MWKNIRDITLKWPHWNRRICVKGKDSMNNYWTSPLLPRWSILLFFFHFSNKAGWILKEIDSSCTQIVTYSRIFEQLIHFIFEGPTNSYFVDNYRKIKDKAIPGRFSILYTSKASCDQWTSPFAPRKTEIVYKTYSSQQTGRIHRRLIRTFDGCIHA